MNPEEWKKEQDAMTQETYDTLKQIDAKDVEREETFSGTYFLRLPPNQFPYDLATEIKAQLEGTGSGNRYELRFYYWVKRLRICQSFDIDTDQENKIVIEILNKTNQVTREKIVAVLQRELNDLRRSLSSSEDLAYTAWRMSEPSTKGKIQRIEEAIGELLSP
ncbi:hypothetical protein MUP77_21450 [Candidatus Bathyarchaeota archaeon]|nr:hypothetical protein [Candidatus Bathyarchaeota archaeon]